MTKRSSLTLALACCGMALFGCNGGDSSGGSTGGATTGSNAAGGGKHYKIAVIPKGSTHGYWNWVHEGANQAAKELGNVDIDWEGPQQEDDKEAEIKIVEDKITQADDGIVLAPLDNKALSNPVKDAQKANIPVVIIDSGLDGDGYISFIATDNYKGGQMAADALSKDLGGKGDVIMLRYEVGSASTDAREKGFMDELAKTSPGIRVVSSDQYGDATADTAQKASENLLARFKKGDGLAVQGIYCPNESTTFGMLRALEGIKAAGKVKFVGFDASDALIAALKKGEIDGLIIQNPRKMGYDGVKAIVEYLKGNKNVAKTEDTGATLVTKDNVDKPDIQALVVPPNV